MKSLFTVLAFPFVWLWTTLTGPICPAKIVVVLSGATIVYLVLQLNVVDSIGKRYFRKKWDLLYTEFNRQWGSEPEQYSYQDLELNQYLEFNQYLHQELKHDRYYRFLRRVRATLIIVVGFFYAYTFPLMTGDLIMRHIVDHKVAADMIGWALGTAACFISLLGAVWLTDQLHYLKYDIKRIQRDRRATERQYATQSLQLDFSDFDDTGHYWHV